MRGGHVFRLGASPHAAQVSQSLCQYSHVPPHSPIPHSPIPRPSGGFESTLKLPMESSFEYKFVVNGEWTHVEDQVLHVAV